MWYSLKKIRIKYEYLEGVRNDISSYFFNQASLNNKIQAFENSFKYFNALIGCAFIIILFILGYNIPFLREIKLSNYTIPVTTSAISILSFIIATISLGMARERARDAKRLSDIKQLQTALELFYIDHKQYPIAEDINGLAKQISLIKNPYMSTLPTDPTGEADFKYHYKSKNGKTYILKYKLEKDGDKKAGPNGIDI